MSVFQVSELSIRGARCLDAAGLELSLPEVQVRDGFLNSSRTRGAEVLNAECLLLVPGLMDIHVHLREPGQIHKETIATGTSAAAAGGFTFVACMPNTTPALDSPETIRLVLQRAREADHCDVGVVAAITRGREGRELTDFRALLDAGAVAFSDDGVGVERDDVMRAAFERAAELDALLIQHCEYSALSAGGVMHQGDVSRRLGFPGLDPRSEEAMIERDVDLCRKTGGRYHVAHISTERAVELVRRAKAEGLPVTSEVTPHHLLLTDEDCSTGDPNTKMHPPLRTRKDVEACRQGLLDGTIDCIATDHAPHAADEKARGFLKAPPGLVGLETAVGLAARAMVESGLAGWDKLVRWFAGGPARVLRLDRRGHETGHTANFTLLDPTAAWTVDPNTFQSRSRNTPFAGWRLTGRAVAVIRGIRIIECFEGGLTGRLGNKSG
jgi:dihydroorotase